MSCMILLFLVGCSNLKIIYRQLDWFLPAYIDQYINLEDLQYRFVENKVDELLHWHCSNELTQYADLLSAIAIDLKDKQIDREKIAFYQSRVDDLWRHLAIQATPAIVEFFSTVSDEQLQQLSRKLDEQNTDIRDDFVDASKEDVRNLLAKRMRGRIERWIDDLEAGQTAIINDWSMKAIGGQKLWFENRMTWQAHFLDAVKNYRQDQKRLSAELNHLINQPDDLRTQEYIQQVKAYRQNIQDLLLRLVTSMTEKQQGYMINSLDSYASDFRDLACQT